jgi:hypothetical protein
MASEYVVADGAPPTIPINVEFRATIGRLVRAKTPLIAVLTHEELLAILIMMGKQAKAR